MRILIIKEFEIENYIFYQYIIIIYVRKNINREDNRGKDPQILQRLEEIRYRGISIINKKMLK